MAERKNQSQADKPESDQLPPDPGPGPEEQEQEQDAEPEVRRMTPREEARTAILGAIRELHDRQEEGDVKTAIANEHDRIGTGWRFSIDYKPITPGS